MAELGAIFGQAFGWFQTWIFWGVVIFFMFAGGIGGALIRKKRKMRYPSAEFIPMGNGQMSLRINLKHGAGYLRKKKIFFGLIDYGGEEQLTLKDGRKVFNSSSEDFIEINGRRGPLVVRKADDPEILVQITRQSLDPVSLRLLAEVAPGDLRDAADELITSGERELRNKLEKVLPYVAIGFIVLLALIVIVMSVQFANNRMDKASEFYEKALQQQAQTPQLIAEQVGKALREALNSNTIITPSTAP